MDVKLSFLRPLKKAHKQVSNFASKKKNSSAYSWPSKIIQNVLCTNIISFLAFWTTILNLHYVGVKFWFDRKKDQFVQNKPSAQLMNASKQV